MATVRLSTLAIPTGTFDKPLGPLARVRAKLRDRETVHQGFAAL